MSALRRFLKMLAAIGLGLIAWNIHHEPSQATIWFASIVLACDGIVRICQAISGAECVHQLETP